MSDTHWQIGSSTLKTIIHESLYGDVLLSDNTFQHVSMIGVIRSLPHLFMMICG